MTAAVEEGVRGVAVEHQKDWPLPLVHVVDPVPVEVDVVVRVGEEGQSAASRPPRCPNPVMPMTFLLYPFGERQRSPVATCRPDERL